MANAGGGLGTKAAFVDGWAGWIGREGQRPEEACTQTVWKREAIGYPSSANNGL